MYSGRKVGGIDEKTEPQRSSDILFLFFKRIREKLEASMGSQRYKKGHPAIYCRPELSIPHHFFRLGIGQS